MAASLAPLIRWVRASYIKALKPLLEGKPLYVEGDQRLTNQTDQSIEIRIDGPYLTPVGTRGEYRAYIEVNLLVNSGYNQKNRYEADNLRGLLMNALNRDFCIYRTGNNIQEETDDNSLVGVMQLIPSQMIKVSNFGQINPDAKVNQSVAEAHYEMYFTSRE